MGTDISMTPRTTVTITPVSARVLRLFLTDPARPRYGYDMMRLARITSGSLYPMLRRFETAGWLQANPEDIDPRRARRPARRYYRLTDAGIREARDALTALVETYRPPKPVRSPGKTGPSGGRRRLEQLALV